MRILIFAGPSGGHLFPAVALAEFFKKRHQDTECHLVVTKRISSWLKSSILSRCEKVFYLPDFPFPRPFSLKSIPFLLKLSQAFFKTREIIRQINPDVIVAFGTFVSFPGVILGYFKKIPTVLHEQNVELGRANKILVPFATKVAVSFPITLEKLPSHKGVWVGNILRPEMFETARQRVLRKGDKLQILILGGSQGASLLNHHVLQTFKLLTAEEKQKVAVIHITGVSDFPKLEHAYDELGIENQVFAFTDEIAGCYATTDLVIARAGAGTIAEVALFGLPSILIPYPRAGSHQLANARYLTEREAAYLVEESSLSPERLKEMIFSLLRDGVKLETMRDRVRQLAKPDAGFQLVEEIEQLLP